MTISQGFLVELNDMHGKMHSQSVFNANGSLISQIIYHYKVNGAFSFDKANYLSNIIDAVLPDGSIHRAYKGMSTEVYHDARQSSYTLSSKAPEVNAGFLAFTAFPIPLGWASYADNRLSYQEHAKFLTTTKVIQRRGILEKVEAIQDGSKVVTENLLWDAHTGQVLLTSIDNEFDDKLYSVTYPAHWAYEKGMGHAYKNQGLRINSAQGKKIVNGWLEIPNAKQHFVPGDKLRLVTTVRGMQGFFFALTKPSGADPITVIEVNEALDGAWELGITNQSNLSVSIDFIKNVTVNRVVCPNIYSTKYEKKRHCLLCSYYCDYDGQGDLISWACANYNRPQFCATGRVDGFFIDDSPNSFSYIFPDNLPPVSVCISGSDGCDKYVPPCGDTQFGCDQAGDNCKNYKDFDAVYRNDIIATRPLDVWVQSVDNNRVRLITKDGVPVEVNPSTNNVVHELEVLRSGRRNQASFPLAKVTVLNSNPIETYAGSSGPAKRLALDNSKVLSASALEYSDAWHQYCCGTSGAGQDCVDPCKPVNPFASNLRGNWRLWRSYTYLDQRKATLAVPERNIAADGVFAGAFEAFWQRRDGTWKVTLSAKWKETGASTYVNPYGNELESRDALNRYSAVLYGYRHTLPLAVGSNTKLRQLMYEGFEDYVYDSRQGTCLLSPHFPFGVATGAQIVRGSRKLLHNGFSQGNIPASYTNSGALVVQDFGHTGTHSLCLLGGSGGNGPKEASGFRSVSTCTEPLAIAPVLVENSLSECRDCISKFSIKPGEDMVLQAWVRTEELSRPSENLGARIKPLPTINGMIEVLFLDAEGNVLEAIPVTPNTVNVDGWLRIEHAFSVPSNPRVAAVGMRLVGHQGTNDDNLYATFFDDIRLQPFDAGVKSYVYDPYTLRLKAELDNRNFATFYDCDEDGTVVRMRRETARGVYTVQESRTNLHKR